ncbi:transposase [Paenibacillus sp. FSL M7-1046]|uniref:transposase n=1 Tax=Paenibacillus sp. FSL M7-1046 TaxID=2975315 RepID=UPI0021167FDF|nr:transposase [Paenibacillus borealis]
MQRRLEFDLRFCYQCGLRLYRLTPATSTISRVFADLTRKGIAQRLFEDLVTEFQEAGLMDGTQVAIDSTASTPMRKKSRNVKASLRATPTGA